jgi:hypothetical protein
MTPIKITRDIVIDNVAYEATGCINHVGTETDNGHCIYLTKNSKNMLQIRNDDDTIDTNRPWKKINNAIIKQKLG